VEGRGLNEKKSKDSDPYWFDRIQNVMIPNIQKLLKAFRTHGKEVMFTTIESLTQDGRDQSLDYKVSGFLVPRGSDDAKVVPEIAPEFDEICFPKTSASVFNSTSIQYVLRNMGIQQLAVCGMVTNQCIESTIRDAADLGFFCTLIADATAAHSHNEQASAEHNLKGFCVIQNTKDVLDLLSNHETCIRLPPQSFRPSLPPL